MFIMESVDVCPQLLYIQITIGPDYFINQSHAYGTSTIDWTPVPYYDLWKNR